MFTEADKTLVEKAIRHMSKGERVMSVTTSDRTVSYSNPSLDQLKDLLVDINRELSRTVAGSRVVHLRTYKNL